MTAHCVSSIRAEACVSRNCKSRRMTTRYGDGTTCRAAGAPPALAACTVSAMQPVTDFQLIRYIDTTAVDLVAVCGKCRRAAVVDVRAIIDAEGANVWLGAIREHQHCGAQVAQLFTRALPMSSF
jgi:hypothetical protein